MTENTFLNQTETAELLRLSPRTLERMRVDSTGPRFRKFGRRVAYAAVDVHAWADTRAFQSTSEAHERR
jgi:predicted DNA-binding transcriptional regulator AlpA